jgi:4-diphosphocytidyl-2-C-methyl-D-erythritol kinase
LISLFSPAKLNLFFRVLHKRNDGFHEIASLFQAIDLGDILEFSKSDHDSLSCTDPSLSLGSDNLICKAIELFRKKTRLSNFFVRCHLTKRIPIQTGIGGGSSNAATTLYACNELAGRPAAFEELKTWAGDLGSDVAFFFSSGSAYCTGRGEKVENVFYPLETVFASPCFLAKPTFGLSTPEVYKACRPNALKARDPRGSLENFINGKPEWYNDLETAAFSISSQFQNHMNALRDNGFSDVILTGSGSGAFCFGRENPPIMDGVQFYRIHPLARNSDGWYSKNN